MERQLSKNLVYLCKDKPKSARELSDELCVPMPYIEEELEIQCRGENGSYGMLRKLDNGKYTINVLVVDYSEYDAASRIFENYLPQICRLLGRTLEEKKEEILRFPYLSPQTDIRFILWALISRVFWGLKDDIHVIIKSRYFADIPPTSSRPFTCAAIAFDAGTKPGRRSLISMDPTGSTPAPSEVIGTYSFPISMENGSTGILAADTICPMTPSCSWF